MKKILEIENIDLPPVIIHCQAAATAAAAAACIQRGWEIPPKNQWGNMVKPWENVVKPWENVGKLWEIHYQ